MNFDKLRLKALPDPDRQQTLLIPKLWISKLCPFARTSSWWQGRVFRVISMQNIMVYPASIACEIAPEYEDIDEQNQFTDFESETLTLLKDNEDDD